MEIQIRRASLNDIPYLIKLLFQVHKVHSDARPDVFKNSAKKYTENELVTILQSKENPVFVAQKGTEIIGYAFCIHKEIKNHKSLQDIRTLYIDDLCVDEAYRGCHIGKTLYEYVINYGKSHKYYNITLNVWANNENAVKFYKKIGMRIQKIGMETIL